MGGFGRSRWALLAALLLLVMGGLMSAAGLALLLGAEVPNVVGGGVTWIGLPFLLVGLLQVGAGWSAWKHGRPGQFLGIAIALLGVFLGVQFVPSVNNAVHEAGSWWPAIRWAVVLAIVPLAVVAAGLLFGNRHFVRQP
jgi:hypothetical protein